MCPPFNVPNAITLTICIALEMFSTEDDREKSRKEGVRRRGDMRGRKRGGERRERRGEKGAEKEERRKKVRGEEKEER